MRILGIDPGLATLGFALLEKGAQKNKLLEYGVIRTHAKTQKNLRLLEIHKDLSKLIKEFKPDVCAIEQIFFSKNITTGIQVAEARGIILMALAEAGIPTHEYSPSRLKRAVTGDGRADKKSMQKMIQLELGLAKIPQPDDAADAICLALALASELR